MGDHDKDGSEVVEAKVWAATGAAGLAAGGVAILNAIQDDPTMLGALPVWLQTLLLLLVPPLITFGSGYLKTSNRT